MNEKKSPVRGLAMILGFGLVLLTGCTGNGRPHEPGRLPGNGVIEATEVNLTAKIAGKIASLTPREGDAVARGDLVCSLEAEEVEGQVQQAQGALAVAEARLAELLAGTRQEEIKRARAQLQAAEEQLAQALARLSLVNQGPRAEQIEQARATVAQTEASLRDAETELKRAQNLEKQGALPGQQVDLLETRRDVAGAQVQVAREKLREARNGARPQEKQEATALVSAARAQRDAASAALDLALAGPRPEVIQAARAQVEQARGTLHIASATLGQALIRAPLNGRITLRNTEPGELVTPGMTILRVSRLDQVWLRVFVPEGDVGEVKLGQKAQVFPDALAGKTFTGTVTEIAQEPEFTPKNVQTQSERTKLVYGVKITIDNPKGDLKPGMPADAVIETRP